MESNNEATQLYILAAQILGRRPEGIPRRTVPVLKAFTELAAFSSSLIHLQLSCDVSNSSTGTVGRGSHRWRLTV